MAGRAALKTGVEGVFLAILPKTRTAIAVKIADGATRAAECAIAALLVREGALDPAEAEAARRLVAPVVNWCGIRTGEVRPAAALRD